MLPSKILYYSENYAQAPILTRGSLPALLYSWNGNLTAKFQGVVTSK